MPSLLRPALAAAATLGALAGEVLPSFEEFLAERRLSFPEGEVAHRRALFDAAAAKVQEQNAKPDGLWKAELNHLSVKTQAEMRAMFGYVKQTGEDRATARPGLVGHADLPQRVDWREAFPSVVTPVKNQGGCGSCWAFASTAVLESAVAISTGVLFDLAPQQLTSCVQNVLECGGTGGCGGGTAELAFNYTAKHGITSEWSFPYTSGIDGANGTCYDLLGVRAPVAGIVGYHFLPRNDPTALMQAVQLQPTAITVAATEWSPYKSGVFNGCNMQNPDLNHNVVLNGYGKDGNVAYWLVRNSWGPTWGEKGYIRIIRHPEGEPCGVDTTPFDGYSCRKQNPPQNVTACGMCGILADSAYPIGAFLGPPAVPLDPVLTTHKPLRLAQPADAAAFV